MHSWLWVGLHNQKCKSYVNSKMFALLLFSWNMYPKHFHSWGFSPCFFLIVATLISECALSASLKEENDLYLEEVHCFMQLRNLKCKEVFFRSNGTMRERNFEAMVKNFPETRRCWKCDNRCTVAKKAVLIKHSVQSRTSIQNIA